MSTNDPFRVLANDGMEHLEYDLIISNVFGAPVTLAAVEVVALDGASLLRLEGSQLAARVQPVFYSGPVPSDAADGAAIEVPVGGMVAMTMDVLVPPDRVPSGISHRIDYAFPADDPFASLVNGRTVNGPELTLDPREPIVLAPPVRGDGWFAGDACCAADSAHRSFRVTVDGERIYKTETFAYDWLRIQDGRLFEGDGSRAEQWFNYGAEVVAAAEGTVVAVRDGMPDEEPFHRPQHVKTPRDYSGNHVVVQIAPEVWATYAHLQPGSIEVGVGDQVATGQLLGLLGNTGNSPLAPHLHFQLSDGPEIATSSSLPFVFDHYALAGTVDPEDLWAVIENRDDPVLPIAGSPQEQNETYALGMTIQDFP
jgi:hypothetical protein